MQSIYMFFVFFVVMFMVVKFWKRKRSTHKLPPGPWKLPLIGNLHQLAASNKLPHHSLAELSKKHGPVMHLQIGENPTMIISSPRASEEVLKVHDITFAQRPRVLGADIVGYGDKGIVFSPFGDSWRQLRKICVLELLTSKRIYSFKSLREEETYNLIDTISSSNRQTINLSEKIFKLTNDISSRAIFGDKCKDADEFISTMKEAAVLSSGFDMFDIFPSFQFLSFLSGMLVGLEKLHERFDKILEKIINDHRDKGTGSINGIGEEDLLTVLLKLQDSDSLDIPVTTTNIKAIILDLFGAGTDTSATTMEWAMSEMMRNPRVLKKAQAEIRQVLNKGRKITEEDIQELNYLKLVIKETLRLHPPVPLSTREARENCQISGYDIPKKTKVIVNIWAISRDAEYWKEDADCFRPERFEGSSLTYYGNNLAYTPFGSGRRICPGILFANANMELALAMLLYHFDWKLPQEMKPEELDMTEAFGLSVKKKNDLHVFATPAQQHYM